MQVVIFAGGLGTRLSEKTNSIPKPMVKIGNMPILEHIMDIYSIQGHTEFIIACGYKQEIIKRYFYEKLTLGKDLHIQFNKEKRISTIENKYKNWKISLIDTGFLTHTGSRLLKLKPFLDDQFFLTYGDGVGNVNLKNLINQHYQTKAEITITTINPTSRYGSLIVKGNKVKTFIEKPEFSSEIVNAGFMFLNKSFLRFIDTDEVNIALEAEPFQRAVNNGVMGAFHHSGFWHPMDTLRDNIKLNKLWNEGNPPWLEVPPFIT